MSNLKGGSIMPLNLDYYYGGEAEQYSFYRIPKVLFTDEHYKPLSVEAKVLYGLLLDRMSLSVRNRWLDGGGRVFIYFTLDDAMVLMACGKDKAVRLFKELDAIGLIERQKQGQGRPIRIYVKNFIIPEVQTSEKPKSEAAEAVTRAAYEANAEVQTSGNPRPRLPENRSQDFCKTAANNTEIIQTQENKTDFIYTDPSSTPSPPKRRRDTMRSEEMDFYRELVSKNIEYDVLLSEYPLDGEILDGYVELIAEICCSKRETIRVGGENIPTSMVRDRLIKLNREHICYVLESLKNNTTLVKNVRAYTLASLYNSPVTIGQYYASLVSHDMAGNFS